MNSEIKTALILGIVIAAGLGVMGVVFSSLDEEAKSTTIVSAEGNLITKIDKSGFKKAPDLVGIAHYLNTTLEDLSKEIDGKVVLYDIWTYSCINCIRTLPFITAWKVCNICKLICKYKNSQHYDESTQDYVVVF